MQNNALIPLERLASLYKSNMRQAANEEGIQLVHVEVLQYLSICNQYSNTAQALSEYLGQTKGSISQSIKLMEKAGNIERKPCSKDKRVIKLHLTKSGSLCLRRVSKKMNSFPQGSETVLKLESILKEWQPKHSQQSFGQCGSSQQSFGQCGSCHYNIRLKSNRFRCGLTQEPLSSKDIKKICREHQFPDE